MEGRDKQATGAGHLEFNSVPPPGHLQTTKSLLRNILSLFLKMLKVRSFKHRHFGIRRSFINHKRPIKAIKPFALSFLSRMDSIRNLFGAVLLSFLYIGRMDWGVRHLTIIVGTGDGAFANKNCP